MAGERAVTETAIIHRYIQAYNAFDLAGMLTLLSPDVLFENYSSDALTASAKGADEFRQLAEQSVSMFSVREQRILSLRTHGGSVIVDIAYRGTLAVDLPDGPMAGTLIELKGTSEFSFDRRLIRKIVDRS